MRRKLCTPVPVIFVLLPTSWPRGGCCWCAATSNCSCGTRHCLLLLLWFLVCGGVLLCCCRCCCYRMLLLLLVTLYVTQSRESFVRSWRSWFLGSCLLHTLVDIPVHHDDGPLIFWPFNWTYRFASPISYWDPAHYGVPTMIFEGGLVVCLAAMLIWQRYRSRPRT